MKAPKPYAYSGTGYDRQAIEDEARLVERQREVRRVELEGLAVRAAAEGSRMRAVRESSLAEYRRAQAEEFSRRMASQPPPIFGGPGGLQLAADEAEAFMKQHPHFKAKAAARRKATAEVAR